MKKYARPKKGGKGLNQCERQLGETVRWIGDAKLKPTKVYVVDESFTAHTRNPCGDRKGFKKSEPRSHRDNIDNTTEEDKKMKCDTRV